MNVSTLNIRASKYTKQLLVDVKGEIHSTAVTVGDFNTPLTSMGRLFRQEINNEIMALTITLNVT